MRTFGGDTTASAEPPYVPSLARMRAASAALPLLSADARLRFRAFLTKSFIAHLLVLDRPGYAGAVQQEWRCYEPAVSASGTMPSSSMVSAVKYPAYATCTPITLGSVA